MIAPWLSADDRPTLAADALIAARLTGAPDNVTVVVADVLEEGTEVPESRRRLLGAAAESSAAAPRSADRRHR